MDEFKRWAVISANPRIGPKTLYRLRDGFETAELALKAGRSEYLSLGIDQATADLVASQKDLDADVVINQLDKLGITFVWHEAAEFPESLKVLPDPPAFLYRRGEPLTNASAVAVVGSRKATPYGRQITTDLVQPLARAGVVIVSGLALGIDAMAHQATLDAGGRTIAVLGNGLDDTFPTSHRALAREIIAKNGTVISEFPPGTPAFKQNFPIRNRIIAGLSLGTLVVEAALESGSLITARLALDYNREVFAVPGLITNPMSAGPHGLIRLGAKLVTSAADILEELALEHIIDEADTAAIVADSATEATLLEQLTRTPIQLDDLIRESGLDAATVTGALLLMEMKGKARNLGANQYVIGH